MLTHCPLLCTGYLRHNTGSKVGNKYQFRDSNTSLYILDVDDTKHTIKSTQSRSTRRRRKQRVYHHDDDTIYNDIGDGDSADGHFGIFSSDEYDEDNELMFREIVNIQDHTTKRKRRRMDRLGTNHNAVIEWLLSLYSESPFELRALAHDKLKGLIKAPNPSLPLSSTLPADSDEIEDAKPEIPELVLGDSSIGDKRGKQRLDEKRYLLNVESTEYHLNLIYRLNPEQREQLLSVQGTTFNSYSEAIEFVLVTLWDIYNAIAVSIYGALIEELSLVEKAKMLSVGVERKSRIRNLTKYKNCFMGNEAVVFMLKSYVDYVLNLNVNVLWICSPNDGVLCCLQINNE